MVFQQLHLRFSKENNLTKKKTLTRVFFLVLVIYDSIVKYTCTMLSKNIKNNIQELRQAKGMTQSELAEAVGVTRQTIIAIEKGNYTPSLLLAFAFSHVFKKPLETIFWQ